MCRCPLRRSYSNNSAKTIQSNLWCYINIMITMCRQSSAFHGCFHLWLHLFPQEDFGRIDFLICSASELNRMMITDRTQLITLINITISMGALSVCVVFLKILYYDITRLSEEINAEIDRFKVNLQRSILLPLFKSYQQ